MQKAKIWNVTLKRMKIWHESFYSTDWKKRDMLKWPQRMAISIGIARGVHFLHTGVAPGIFGNKLKIENILLDDSLNARVSGYSIPLPSKVRTDKLHNLIILLDNNIFMITSQDSNLQWYLSWSIFRVHLMNKVPPIILEGIFLCLIPFYSVLFHCYILIIICFLKLNPYAAQIMQKRKISISWVLFYLKLLLADKLHPPVK